MAGEKVFVVSATHCNFIVGENLGKDRTDLRETVIPAEIFLPLEESLNRKILVYRLSGKSHSNSTMASTKAISLHQMGEWATLLAHFPGQAAPQPIGIVFRETCDDRLTVKLCPDWWAPFPDEEAALLWGGFEEYIIQMANELGAGAYLDYLESTASHVVQLSTRQPMVYQDASIAIETLYRQEVEACSSQLRQEVESNSSKQEQPTEAVLHQLGRFQNLRSMMTQEFRRPFDWMSHLPVGLKGALAASLALGVVVSQIKPKPKAQQIAFSNQQTPALSNQQAPETAALPPLQHSTWALDLHSNDAEDADSAPVFLSLAAWHPRGHKTIASKIKKFQPLALQPVIPKVRTVHFDVPPPPKIKTELKPSKTTPKLIAKLPSTEDIPKYRSRNKLVRVLSVLATPFKNPPPPSQAPKTFR